LFQLIYLYFNPLCKASIKRSLSTWFLYTEDGSEFAFHFLSYHATNFNLAARSRASIREPAPTGLDLCKGMHARIAGLKT
jgi:hypothetical protein